MKKAIRAKRLVDGTGKTIEDAALFIDGEKIACVGRSPQVSVPDDAEVFDAGDATILPGLIECHVHTTFDAGPEPVASMKAASDDEVLMLAAHAAGQMLRAGITAARDCGGRDDLTHRLKNAINKGIVPGPHLFTAGRPLTSSKGHCWFMNGEAGDERELLKRIDEEFERGADFIKIMSTGGGMTVGTTPLRQQFPWQTLEKAAERIHREGKRLACHAHGAEGIGNCARAGVDTIEHCTFLTEDGPMIDEEVLALLKKADPYIVVTLAPGVRSLNSSKPLGTMTTRRPLTRQQFHEQRLEVGRRMYRDGFKIVGGADAGVGDLPHNGLLLEVQSLPKLGLSNMEALCAATSGSARALGIDSIAGTLEPGKRADVLVVRGDAVADLSALNRTAYVFKDGKLTHSTPA